MSVSYEVTDRVTPMLKALARSLTTQRLAAAVGPACSKLVKTHLRALPSNKRGWSTTNFWSRAAKATGWQPHPDGAIISVNQIGVRQRWKGGMIRPVNAKALALPCSPVSYGHVPADFPMLFVLKTPKGAYLVQHGDEIGARTSKKDKKAFKRNAGGNFKQRIEAKLNFLFKLSGGVNQAENPDVMPSREEMMATAKAAIMAAIKPRGPGVSTVS